MKIRYLLFVVVAVLIFGGCSSETEGKVYKNSKWNLSFSYPTGWTEIEQDEWDQLDYGANNTIIAVGTDDRECIFAVIPVDLDKQTMQLLNSLGNNPNDRKGTFAHSIVLAGERQYEEFEKLESGITKYANSEWGEAEYYGRNPGRNRRYFRILVNTSKDREDLLLMLVSTAPVGEENKYKEQFNIIENNFKWDY